MQGALSSKTGSNLLEISEFLKKYPGGSFFRNYYIRRLLPHIRGTGIRVTHLLPGQCDANIKDRVRNHNDHHAIHESHLSNLAEHTARLALATALPENCHANLTALSLEFIGSAHGSIFASSRCDLPKTEQRQEMIVMIELVGGNGARVATGMATWLITPDIDSGDLEG